MGATMKLLSIGKIYFKLSDESSSGLSAALRELADYLDTPSDPLPAIKATTTEPYRIFEECVNNGGRLFIADQSVRQLVNNEWMEF